MNKMEAMEIPTSSVMYNTYRPSAVLNVTGPDADAFLQGQFTQDLLFGSGSGKVVYGLWLNQKGKVQADSFVFRSAGGWRCVSYFSPGPELAKRLEAYIIADDVTVTDVTASWAGLCVNGRGASDALASLGIVAPSVGLCVEAGRSVIFQGRRAVQDAWEWLYPIDGDDPAVLLGKRGDLEIGADVLERLRIEAGIPRVPFDIGPEDLPNEGGLEDVAISYTKGCYLGQEVIARIKSMGQVRRRLVRVEGPGSPPTRLPAPLFADGKKLGELRSVALTATGFVGLAMISLLGMTGRRLLGFSPDGEASIVVSHEG